MTPETAALAERLWTDFIRVWLIGAGVVWGVLMLLLVAGAIAVEAARERAVDAALRDLGVTTRPARRRGDAARDEPPASAGRGAAGQPAGPKGWAAGASRPAPRRHWPRGA